MPISSYYSYDNQGSTYNASLVITDGILDYDKYQAYSPIFLPATLCLAYGLSFAMFPAVVVHTFCQFSPHVMVTMLTSFFQCGSAKTLFVDSDHL